MADSRLYYAPGSLSAAFYEVVTAADARLAGDLEIYAGLAPPGGSILELGAGAGRLTLPLAELGFSVTGVDIAEAMLAQARERLAAAPETVAGRVELVAGDMTALDLRRTFDLVFCPFFTLAHVGLGEPWARTFATAARHLRPGGLAAFHLPLAEMMRRPAPADSQAPALDQPLPGGGRLQLRILQRSWREDLGRFDQFVDYAELGPTGEVLRRSVEQMTFHLADPQPYAEAAGLALDRPPIRHGGVGDIWVFRKPE